MYLTLLLTIFHWTICSWLFPPVAPGSRYFSLISVWFENQLSYENSQWTWSLHSFCQLHYHWFAMQFKLRLIWKVCTAWPPASQQTCENECRTDDGWTQTRAHGSREGNPWNIQTWLAKGLAGMQSLKFGSGGAKTCKMTGLVLYVQWEKSCFSPFHRQPRMFPVFLLDFPRASKLNKTFSHTVRQHYIYSSLYMLHEILKFESIS